MERTRGSRAVRLTAVTVLCSLISTLGLGLAAWLQLPFWLDSVGICLAAYYTRRLWLTLVTALLAYLAVGPVLALPLSFILGNLLIACVVYGVVHWGYLQSLRRAMVSSFGTGLISVLLYTPLVMKLGGGVTLNLWGDALIDMLRFYGAPETLCVMAGVAVVDILDKQLCFLLAFLLMRLVKTLKRRRRKQLARTAGMAVLLAALLVPMAVPAAAHPQEKQDMTTSSLSDYVQTIYNNTNGLPATAINAVAHTPDGSIWVGGYAGLCLYDGTEFHYITEGRIANVTALLTDRQGRLWVGTNDQGVAVLVNKKFHFISRSNGLSDNSVRTIFQADGGDIYVGTLGALCRISEDLQTVTQLDSKSTGVWNIAQNSRGLMACVDYSGGMFLMKNDQILAKWDPDPVLGRYTCVLDDGEGFLLATSDNHVLRFSSRGIVADERDEIFVDDLQFINRMKWDSKGNLWICAYNGVGYRTPGGDLVMLRYPDFNKSIEDVIEDYEGNYWLTSSSDGLMKLSRSPFSDIHAFLGLEPESVNAVTSFRGTMYCATDSGLTVVDPDGQVIEDAMSRAAGDHRVRCVQVDSQDRLWACTYGGGLLCWPGGEEPVRRITQQDGAAGDYFRCLQELPDGTMVAGGSEGMTFVKDGKVTGILNGENGLDMTQILCMTLDREGNLYAGSDGSGIYVIRDGSVVKTINEEQGLSSRIILRMIPYQDGCFVVTSNSLNYLQDGQGRVLDQFPYFNNFDMVIYGEQAWVLASCGIIVVNLEKLLAEDGQPLRYRLFNYKNGLQGSLTANSWVYVDNVGQLYLCTNIGVQRINMHQPLAMRDDYKMSFGRFTADGEPVVRREGVYHIGAEVDSIEVDAAIFNYDQVNLRVRFFLEGVDKNPPVIRQSDLSSVTYRNIRHGTYTLRLQILDDQLQVRQQLSCPVVKEARMWENTYYHMYLLVVLTWMIMFATWSVLSILQTSRRKRELEIMSLELEGQVREQTEQIVAQSQKLTEMQQHTIEGMATLIESRDGSTGAHVRNTGVYAQMLAQELYRRGLYPEEIDQKFVEMIGRLAPLHDVGKIKISDLILNKPGRLTDEEYEIMKSHAAWGGEIISQILGKDADLDNLRMAKDIARFHHERWDGQGYPEGRRGEEIPLCARIMAVADVFDALSSKRVYKDSMSIDSTFAEMKRNEGTQFQTELVEILLDLRTDIEAYLDQNRPS